MGDSDLEFYTREAYSKGDADGYARAVRTHRHSPAFHNALANLCSHVTPSLAFRVMRVWHHISARCEPPEPILETVDADSIRFAWSSSKSYLDLEVYDDGTFEWFYSDRSGTVDGVDGTKEDREEVLPEAFYVRLESLAECP